MAFAVMHVLGAIIILEIVRHYIIGPKKFPKYLVVIGGIAGLLPDIDIPLGWVYFWVSGVHVDLHATSISHSLIWVVLFVSLGLLFRCIADKRWSYIAYVIAAGWAIHIGFDWFYGEYKLIFWPFATSQSFFPTWEIWRYSESIDAILLVLWLVHEEIHKRIKDYF